MQILSKQMFRPISYATDCGINQGLHCLPLFQQFLDIPICSKIDMFNTYQAMGRFSRQQIGDVFLIFQENRIWHFMQIVSLGNNLHEVSDPIF